MNRVFVNGRFLTRRATGVDRFATEVLVAIGELARRGDPLANSMRFEVLLPPGPTMASIDMPTRSIGRLRGQAWEQIELSRHVPRDALLLNLCNTGPLLLHNQVVVIHDAATLRVPNSFNWRFRLWYRILMTGLGRRASRIVTVSGFSRDDIVEGFGVPASKIDMVIEGGEHILRTAADKSAMHRFGLDTRPYLLAVSSMAVHKNFKLVLQALECLGDPPFDVAIAGGANAKVFGTEGILQSDQVKWLGHVSDAELRALYEGAMCFVFPSLYEGFGIPPLEAMNCGCPVLASNAASIPEVCGDAALYFDPQDSGALATLMQRVAEDVVLRASLSKQGVVQAGKFSWEQAGRQILSTCRSIFDR